MADDPLDPLLRELSWRRKRASTEDPRLRTWLAAHPEAQADWEEEVDLTEALERLPDVSLASNFTARVMQNLNRADGGKQSSKLWFLGFWRWRWLPKLAVAALVLGGGFHFYRQYEQRQQAEIARGLLAVSEEAAPLNSEALDDVLADFETIRALNQAAPDQRLLTLLQPQE